ncbi:hypothetical protein OH738_00500 [Streptomyces hirsutus]|uniref:Uncharacterized protein n=1 Tax=Streptomyces hirsutus TaxID=35620 RepID=A0ABZ1GY22_9ACTN|nr:hypothetical protein [Streptomyces hirsutus]WSD11142.1 hypothetical protein OIE73_39465 [Streptomyces hirsutus]WTD15505.1 hypothetical protein OH738_00500 [Streptomyces hirsutus]
MDQLAAEGYVPARPLLRMVSLLATAPMPLPLITPGLLTAATGQPATIAGVETALAGLYRYGPLGLPEDCNPRSQPTANDNPPARVVLRPLVSEWCS